MPLLFIALFPVAEILVFVLVGQAVGLAAAIGLILASTVIGFGMLRDAGAITILRLRQGNGLPETILAEGGIRMAAALLLLIPGFLSDIAAFSLLVPRVRRSIARRWGPLQGRSFRPAADGSDATEVIEGEFRRIGD